MNQRLTIRALALGLATLMTLATMGSIDLLAVEQHAGATFARQSAEPVQTVVVTGQRLPRG